MSENASAGNVPEDNLKQKLVMRVAFAGVLIALLLAALAFIDYLGQPGEEPGAAGPTYTEPVPVPRKEVSQPVRPADSAPVAETPPAAAPEGTAPPPAQPAVPVADVPPKPTVSAQPELPPSDSRRQAVGRPARIQTPAEGTSSSPLAPEPERAAPAEPRAEPRTPTPAPAPAPTVPPAPPRLFSGYAVQAGVFSDAQRAEELRAKLMLNGIPSTMEARVQVGPFRTREEAESARAKLKALGIEGILLLPKGAKR